MIKKQLNEIAGMHKVEYAEVKEMFYIVLRLVLVLIICISVVFLSGYYLGTLKK